MDYYSVQEVSSKLKISRRTIYNKLETLQKLKDHVKIENRVKYIDTNGIEIIKQSLVKLNTCEVFTTPSSQLSSKNPVDNTFENFTALHDFTTPPSQLSSNTLSNNTFEDFKSSQDQLILSLQQQLENLRLDKDKQIEYLQKEIDTKNNQIESQNRMLENNQVLLQQSQQKVLFLEQAHSERKSWWKKMFS